MIKKVLNAVEQLAIPDICPICMETLNEPDLCCCRSCYDLLPFPHNRCKICGGENQGYLDICRNCQIEGHRVWFQGITAFNYVEEIRDAVHRYKYSGQVYLARFFARYMAEAWMENNLYFHPDFIVPIPLHWLRRLQRGYNQAELLANELTDLLKIPTSSLLKRIHATQHQARNNSQGRHINLKGAFAVTDENYVRNKNLLLIDDIYTTGSTLNEAAITLKRAGAADISVMTIARDL